MTPPTHYTVTDSRTGKVTTHKTRRAARCRADRLDNAHGSYIATVTPVYALVHTVREFVGQVAHMNAEETGERDGVRRLLTL